MMAVYSSVTILFGCVGLRNVYLSGYVVVIHAYQSSAICVVFMQGILLLVMAAE
jgi:hypothetical protein